MSRFSPDRSQSAKLNNKVVVLTGGSAGIGAAVVRALHDVGASIVFGDIQDQSASELLSSLSNPPNITFVHTDATSYAANIELFKTALQKYGHVDHACAVAGVIETGRWFDPALTISTVENEPSTRTIDVNLIGMAIFTRIATVYLRHGRNDADDKSITLVSSAAGVRESPGFPLPMYAASKHGVMGMMRALRKQLYHGMGKIRINTVNPALTDTPMAASVIAAIKSAESGQPVNSAEDVAAVILAEMTSEDFWGKSLYVEGGASWEMEGQLESTMPLWMGEEPARTNREAHERLKEADFWKLG